LANRGAPPGNDTKLVNGVTPLANGKIGQRSGTSPQFGKETRVVGEGFVPPSPIFVVLRVP
jgi:hypothetical protein